jgi:hypothetical protein
VLTLKACAQLLIQKYAGEKDEASCTAHILAAQKRRYNCLKALVQTINWKNSIDKGLQALLYLGCVPI